MCWHSPVTSFDRQSKRNISVICSIHGIHWGSSAHSLFSLHRALIVAALRELQHRNRAGHDGIPDSATFGLNNESKLPLLQRLNICPTGRTFHYWKHTEVTPVWRRTKYLSYSTSWRLISIESCAQKLFELLVRMSLDCVTT